MTSETLQMCADDKTINAAACLSTAIGLTILLSGLNFDYRGSGLFIAGICFVVAPFALGALGLLFTLILIGVAHPQVGLMLLVAAGCVVCVCIYGTFMISPLGFTLGWTLVVTLMLGHGGKYWCYRTMAIVVEARFCSKKGFCTRRIKGRKFAMSGLETMKFWF